MRWLDALLKQGMCVSYDPTVIDAEEARQVMIQPSGFQHLLWSLRDWEYLGSMAEVTAISEQPVYQELCELHKGPPGKTWAQRIECFGKYLLQADARTVLTSDHEAMKGQTRVVSTLEQTIRSLPY